MNILPESNSTDAEGPKPLSTENLHPAEELSDKTQDETRLAEIAKMAPFVYEQAREELAKKLGVRLSFLDKKFAAMRAKPGDQAEDPFVDVEPASDPVDGAELMEMLQSAILRFCILPDHSAPLIAAWVLHTWAHDSFEISPVLGIVSPEKRCGKTTALSVISSLVPRAMHAVNISASVLFRVIEKYKPTVMVDEADTFLDADKNGDMRGMLNGGHNRLSAYVWRSHGDDHEPRQFKVWAPKAVAMIGNLPDTLEDRSLVVRLRRKRGGEKVERFRADRVNDFLPLRQKAARWAKDYALTLANADPLVPDALHDRAQDNARCICAIADAVGGHWPATIRAALVGMHHNVETDQPQSSGVLLLRDVAKVFETQRSDRIGSTELLNALCALEESPWNEWRGGRLPITPHGIAKLLKPYDIAPRRNMTQRFYSRGDFADAFHRYLPNEDGKSVISDMRAESVMKKHNEINTHDAYGRNDALSDHDGNKARHDGWEGEI